MQVVIFDPKPSQDGEKEKKKKKKSDFFLGGRSGI